MNLHMSYDNAGFEVAVRNSVGQTCTDVDVLVVDGFHDFKAGNCETFQIYNDEGKLLFSFPDSFVEMAKKYSNQKETA